MADAPTRAPQRAIQRPPMRRYIHTGENRFKFDESKVPPGYVYQWKRVACGGVEDTEHQVITEMNGWERVPASRHPELMGQDKGDQPIIRGGLMLMQQPKEWEQESRSIDEFTARHSLEEYIQRIGGNAKRAGAKGVSRDRAVIPELVE